MSALGLDAWWGESDYRATSETISGRGAFILTKFEWKVILEYMGASPQEIADVQMRMRKPWSFDYVGISPTPASLAGNVELCATSPARTSSTV